MQYSVLNVSAMQFGSTFYKGIADGKLIEDAFTEARQGLQATSRNGVDFATPVLFLSDSDCLQVNLPDIQAESTPLDLTGVERAQNFVGRTAEMRELQTRLDPDSGTWRAAVIHAIGGMGKTVLSARLAERMAAHLDGVVSLRMTPATTARDVLEHIGDFLFTHDAYFNRPGILEFQQARNQPIDLKTRVGMLAQILCHLRLLVIFDNCEDILPQAQAVSKQAQAAEGNAAVDPELLPLIASLVGGVDGPSRFVFTSRFDFPVVEEGRLQNCVGHLALPEMGFREAVYLMESLPPLDRLPVALLNQAGAAPVPQGTCMRDVYHKLGGHPFRLNLFARHAARSSVGQVLDDLGEVDGEMLEFTLLERAAERLPERARLLLKRAAVYEEAVPLEGLAYLLGDEQDAMPQVGAELQALLDWGLIAPEPGTQEYRLHSLVRDWAKQSWSEEERKSLQRRAAHYWQGVAWDSHELGDLLRTRHYWFETGEYERADDIVQAATEPLDRWGQWALLLWLLQQSVATLSGSNKAVALGNLATVLMNLGDYHTAAAYFEAALPYFEGDEALSQKSAVLHQVGMLHQDQGEYPQALDFYRRSLKIKEEIGNRAGVSKSLHQIGTLHQQQGEYPQALDFYQRSLKILEEIGDRAGVARSLHQVGMLHQQQGEYPQALDFYKRSLKIKEEIGDRAGVSGSLHQVGTLHQQHGEYPQALDFYQRSLKIDEGIGDRAGVSKSLHQIGMLHQQQGEYPQALDFYQRSLKIEEEIGDRAGVASSLHQVGNLHYLQGQYPQALDFYQRSLKILEEIGDRAGVAGSLGQIGLLYEKIGQASLAVPLLIQALVMFSGMNMPEERIVFSALVRLRQKVGEQDFGKALDGMKLPEETRVALLKALQGSKLEAKAPSAREEEPDPRQLIIQNTTAVLTRVTEKKGEWWQALQKMERQAREQGQPDLAAYLNALMRLVEGASPETLTAGIPEAFAADWQAILAGIRKKE